MKTKNFKKKNQRGKKARAFLDFYAKTGFTPTRQKKWDKKAHFCIRKNLYQQLGVSSSDFKGRSILEIGPGNGHNALYWASLRPKKGALLDGTVTSLRDTRNLLQSNYPREQFNFILKDLNQFRARGKYDVVICEGTIPFQCNPVIFFKKVMKLVSPGGLMIVTCVDSVGVLADILRKFRGQWLTVNEKSLPKQVSILKQEFRKDLQMLSGMTRRAEDWVVDQIIHPWVGQLFSIEKALECVGKQFTVRGTSPSFIQDWRWHKQIPIKRPDFNQNALRCYYKNIFSFLDHKNSHTRSSTADGKALLSICNSIFQDVVTGIPSQRKAQTISIKLKKICKLLPPEARTIRLALNEFSKENIKADQARIKHFRSLWGRGQQYIAFNKEVE
jgi:predicted O-methyltransferase YrrM